MYIGPPGDCRPSSLTAPRTEAAALTHPAGDRDRRVGEEREYRAQCALDLRRMICGRGSRVAHGVSYGLHLMVCESLGGGYHVSSSTGQKDWRISGWGHFVTVK